MDINKFVKNIKISKEDKKYCKASVGGDNKTRGEFIRKILTKEVMEDFFLIQNLTANYISKTLSKKIQVNTGTVIKIARSYGIKTKNVAEQNSRKDLFEQRQNTLFKKYGVRHPLSKDSPFYKKRNKTVLKKYGVSNVFQIKEIKEKSKLTMLKKYGVSHPIFLNDRKFNNGRRSLCHQKIEKILKSLNIQYQSEYGLKEQFKKHNKFLNRDYSPIVDVYIKKYKLVIEIYSDDFHANPSKYDDDALIRTWKGLLKAKDIRTFDKIRKKQIESFGLKVLEIWTSDIRSNINKVKKDINNCLKGDR